MPSYICSETCASAPNPTQSYFDCVDVTREYGANHFALISCDYQFTDITDPAEWEAAIGTGEIAVSPPGTLIQNQPTLTTAEIEGCRREIVGNIEYLYDFRTLQAADDLGDFAYWKDLFNNSKAYKIVPLDCNGLFTMEDEYVDQAMGGSPVITGLSPGFDFSVTVIPHQAEFTETRQAQWVTQFKIKRGKDNGVLCKAALPAVYAAIAA